MRNRAPSGKASSARGVQETVERVGDLHVAQPARGYRYGLDPFLLSAFIQPRLRERVVDIGTGCGILLLLLARRWPTLRIWGVELQEELAGMAEENINRNGFTDRCFALQGDARSLSDLLPAVRFHRVVSNPPFRPPKSGRLSPHPQRAMARQEISLPFAELAKAVSGLLDDGGIFDFVHLPERLPALFLSLMENHLEPKRMQLIQAFRDSPPDLALVSARKGGQAGLAVMPPLVIYRGPGKYTPQARRAFSLPRERRPH